MYFAIMLAGAYQLTRWVMALVDRLERGWPRARENEDGGRGPCRHQRRRPRQRRDPALYPAAD